MLLIRTNSSEDGDMNFTFTKVFVASIFFLIALLGAAFPLDLILWDLILQVSDAVVFTFAAITFVLLIWAGRDIAVGLLSLPAYSHKFPTPPTTDFNNWWQYWHSFHCYGPVCHTVVDG